MSRNCFRNSIGSDCDNTSARSNRRVGLLQGGRLGVHARHKGRARRPLRRPLDRGPQAGRWRTGSSASALMFATPAMSSSRYREMNRMWLRPTRCFRGRSIFRHGGTVFLVGICSKFVYYQRLHAQACSPPPRSPRRSSPSELLWVSVDFTLRSPPWCFRCKHIGREEKEGRRGPRAATQDDDRKELLHLNTRGLGRALRRRLMAFAVDEQEEHAIKRRAADVDGSPSAREGRQILRVSRSCTAAGSALVTKPYSLRV